MFAGRQETQKWLRVWFYRVSHDGHFDIDHDVSTLHCRFSSGDIVGLLSRTICTTVVVSDCCLTNVAQKLFAAGAAYKKCLHMKILQP